jgi:hypothetical protein
MLDLFEVVLYGEVCETDSFHIGPVEMPVDDNQGDRVATALAHSVDDGTPLRIEHWVDEVEFAAYAKTVKTVLGGRD